MSDQQFFIEIMQPTMPYLHNRKLTPQSCGIKLLTKIDVTESFSHNDANVRDTAKELTTLVYKVRGIFLSNPEHVFSAIQTFFYWAYIYFKTKV